ncbi:MAG TPA: hypothetical protein VKA17_04800 [Gammaproteobacteria bacterium]|nr:hypothetical protein [Gammaproteobacteria bacterium]
MSERDAHKDHWLVRPGTIRWLWRIFGLVLGLTVAAQLFVEVHGHFGADGWLGFNALYGFGTCVAMVLFAKLLGFLVKRPENYYRDDDV